MGAAACGGGYHFNRARANTLAGARAVREARPYERDGVVGNGFIRSVVWGASSGMHECIPYEVGLASLFEGGGRRPEGVSYEHREWPIIPTTPPQSAKLTAPPEGEPRAGD